MSLCLVLKVMLSHKVRMLESYASESVEVFFQVYGSIKREGCSLIREKEGVSLLPL